MLYIGFGSDTDCDGKQDYIVVFSADSIDDAWNFIRHRGSMTMEGIHTVALAADALATGNVDGKHYRTALDWLNADAREGVDEPYGYCTTDTRWNPWVEDDTIGIPALDTRYEDE